MSLPVVFVVMLSLMWFIVCKAKHLQFLSGVNPFSYWLGSLCWDFTNYMIPAVVILILFAAFQIDAYSDNLGAVFIILVQFY